MFKQTIYKHVMGIFAIVLSELCHGLHFHAQRSQGIINRPPHGVLICL